MCGDLRLETKRRAGQIGPRDMIVYWPKKGEGTPDPVFPAPAEERRIGSQPEGNKPPHWSERS
jgi:hypothetical protein